MRFESARVFHFDYIGLMTDNYPFLTEDIPKKVIVGELQSHILFFYLKYLYCRKQGNSLGTQYVLQLLTTIFEEESQKSSNELCLIVSYGFLEKAIVDFDDEEKYVNCTFRFLKALKRSNKFETLVQNIQDENMRTAVELV